MSPARGPVLVVLVVAAAAAGCVAAPGADSPYPATVTIRDADSGDVLGRVDAAVADNRSERVAGLRGYDSLPAGTGMLFVFPRTAERAFTMSGMTFPVDVVFVAGNGTVTAVHEARVPENDSGPVYTGRARWVLEVPAGWAATHGVTPGAEVEITWRRTVSIRRKGF